MHVEAVVRYFSFQLIQCDKNTPGLAHKSVFLETHSWFARVFLFRYRNIVPTYLAVCGKCFHFHGFDIVSLVTGLFSFMFHRQSFALVL